MEDINTALRTHQQERSAVLTTRHDYLPAAEVPLCRVSLSFGHLTAGGNPVPPSRIRRAVRYLSLMACHALGGAQVGHHRGTYRKADGSMISEQATTVSAFGHELATHHDHLIQVARRVCRYLHQESVLLTVEQVPGSALYIGANDAD